MDRGPDQDRRQDIWDRRHRHQVHSVSFKTLKEFNRNRFFHNLKRSYVFTKKPVRQSKKILFKNYNFLLSNCSNHTLKFFIISKKSIWCVICIDSMLGNKNNLILTTFLKLKCYLDIYYKLF
jgi:hypothetical protein